MMHKLSTKLKERDKRRRSQAEPRGAAVPYHEPTDSATDDDDDDDGDNSLSENRVENVNCYTVDADSSFFDVASTTSSSSMTPTTLSPQLSVITPGGSVPSTPDRPDAPFSPGFGLKLRPDLLSLDASSRRALVRELFWSGCGSQSILSTPDTPPIYYGCLTSPGSGGMRGGPLELFDVRRDVLSSLAECGDVEQLKLILKSDCSAVNAQDEEGNTALHKAASNGHSRAVRYLLLYGADVDTRNANDYNALFVALKNGHTGTVGILVDYMHSVDNKPREPYVMLRAQRSIDFKNNHQGHNNHQPNHVTSPPTTPEHSPPLDINSHLFTVDIKVDSQQQLQQQQQQDQEEDKFLVERVRTCTQLRSFHRRHVDRVQLLVSHGQKADDLAIFLHSILDVPVTHAFFLNGQGTELNPRHFQRFDDRRLTESLTILNTRMKTIDVTNFQHMRSLILVDCGLTHLTLEGLESLETLDLRHNRLVGLPALLGRCSRLRSLRVANNELKRLSAQIGQLSQLAAFDCSFNKLKRLSTHIVRCSLLKTLQCNDNGLVELPVDLGLLVHLEDLRLNNNKLSQLPVSISALSRLRRITFRSNPLLNIPADFPERAADVRQYLDSLQEDPVANTTVKLVVVGQEGVGKTSLLKTIKKTFWILPPSSGVTSSTDGIDVREIKLNGVTLRCFDCGGDVDFSETHNFFITHGALYLVCFNLSEYCLATVERSSFLFGRLQLWLQYIFSKVPSALVLIVGTHADHPALTRASLEQIWQQLRLLFVDARDHHRRYFSPAERLPDCLLCQADSRCQRQAADSPPVSAGFVNLGFEAGGGGDSSSARSPSRSASAGSRTEAEDAELEEETGFCSGEERTVTFPHVLGYYEVSSGGRVGPVRFPGSSGSSGAGRGVDHLKDAIVEIVRRLIRANPEIPRRWANVDESLRAHVERNGKSTTISTVEEVARIAAVQGVNNRQELVNILHFFKAQGRLLYFPQLADLDELVILDPEWLARVFATVVSHRDVGIDERGFMDRDRLMDSWSDLERPMRDRVLTLLRHFGLCLPVDGTNWELFPGRLPLGEPDPAVWPPLPPSGDKQVTYSVTFPAIIPPPFFNNLIAAVYSFRASSPSSSPTVAGTAATVTTTGETTNNNRTLSTPAEDGPLYFANQIVDWLRLDSVGCRDCGLRGNCAGSVGGASDDHVISGRSLYHRVLIELIAHRRTIQVTARGSLPCCAIKKLSLIFHRVVRNFDGLGQLTFDSVLCPGCFIARHSGSSSSSAGSCGGSVAGGGGGSGSGVHSPAHKFRLRQLLSTVDQHRPCVSSSDGRLICSQGHTTSSCRDLLCGVLSESCLQSAGLVDAIQYGNKKLQQNHKDISLANNNNKNIINNNNNSNSNNSNAVSSHISTVVDNTSCPRLFILLPVNKDGLSFDRDLPLFASTLVPDGYAVHLLCEFPDGYHLTSSPGYRLRSPKTFAQRYGTHVVAVLQLLGRLASSTAVSQQYAARTRVVTRVADSLIRDLAARFPTVRGIADSASTADFHGDGGTKTTRKTPTVSIDHLRHVVDQLSTRLTRDELRRFLHLAGGPPDSFGPLHRLRYDGIGVTSAGTHTLWLCADHYRQMTGVLALGDAAKNDVR